MANEEGTFYRDESCHAVLNKDKGGYLEFVAKRQKSKDFQHLKREVERLNRRVGQLEQTVAALQRVVGT